MSEEDVFMNFGGLGPLLGGLSTKTLVVGGTEFPFRVYSVEERGIPKPHAAPDGKGHKFLVNEASFPLIRERQHHQDFSRLDIVLLLTDVEDCGEVSSKLEEPVLARKQHV